MGESLITRRGGGGGSGGHLALYGRSTITPDYKNYEYLCSYHNVPDGSSSPESMYIFLSTGVKEGYYIGGSGSAAGCSSDNKYCVISTETKLGFKNGYSNMYTWWCSIIALPKGTIDTVGLTALTDFAS